MLFNQRHAFVLFTIVGLLFALCMTSATQLMISFKVQRQGALKQSSITALVYGENVTEPFGRQIVLSTLQSQQHHPTCLLDCNC